MAKKRAYTLLGTNAYQVLGICADTTQGEAKLAFRKLALRYHPDRNSGDDLAAARFKEASEAWDELQDILPKSAVPFPDIDPDDPGFEDAIAQWMLDMDAASPKPEAEGEATAAAPHSARRTWSTVASEDSSATALAREGTATLRDWRTLAMNLGRRSLGLEKINPQEAAILLGFFNAFAALKVVQQNSPECCLYDAIVARAQKSTSTALVILGAEAIDSEACLLALKNPMASIEAAKQNLHLISPFVKYANVPVNPQKLQVDIAFLEDYIKTQLAPRLAKRKGDGSDGTKIVRY